MSKHCAKFQQILSSRFRVHEKFAIPNNKKKKKEGVDIILAHCASATRTIHNNCSAAHTSRLTWHRGRSGRTQSRRRSCCSGGRACWGGGWDRWMGPRTHVGRGVGSTPTSNQEGGGSYRAAVAAKKLYAF